MKIFGVILSFFLLACTFSVQAQYQIPLAISDVNIQLGDEKVLPGAGQELMLQDRNRSQWVKLYNQNGLIIFARYRVKGWHSAISEHKDAGITMRIEYACEYNGRTERIKIVRSFFEKDSRIFKEKQTFQFTNGLYNQKVVLNYSGSLPK
jgi:hypothetical protein